MLHCYTGHLHPRLEYTFDTLLDGRLDCPYRIYTEKRPYLQALGPCLNYSSSRLKREECFIPAGGLLREDGIRELELQVEDHAGRPMFFRQQADDADIPFDLPALIFYLLSRYEEYPDRSLDQHGRFPAQASLAWKEGFLDRPLVDEWIWFLADKLHKKFPELRFRKPAFKVLCTYDIDLAWAYRYRPWWQQLMGAGKALATGQWKNLTQRFRVKFGLEEDPFQTFAYLDKLKERFNFPAHYFFLLPLHLKGPDRTLSSGHPRLQALIRNISERYPVGIHPSYYSLDDPARIGSEIQTLLEITGKPVESSRQHYLRLNLPDTYRHLNDAGIKLDFTMGYAAEPGFRAGTSRPFPWYDLEREEPTGLWIHPFQVMDGTLKNYLQLKPEEALPRIKPLIDRTRATGGIFTTLWHNSSFGHTQGWEGWKETYEAILACLAGEDDPAT